MPPPLTEARAPNGVAALDNARSAAMMGADPGLLVWARHDARLEAALIVAPDRPLSEALPLIFAPAIALSEVVAEVRSPDLCFEWPDRVLSAEHFCGTMMAAASTAEPEIVPDWLVVGLNVALWPCGKGAKTLWPVPPERLTALKVLENWSTTLSAQVDHWHANGSAPLIASFDRLIKRVPTGEPVRLAGDGALLRGDRLPPLALSCVLS